MRTVLLMGAILLSLSVVAQKGKNPKEKPNSWYNKDLKQDKLFGVSSDLSYASFLKSRKAEPVLVAVIDGGTDINHEDLQGIIWTNPGEIPGNNIDDDKNGYVDDVHGWNFIGGANGQNIGKDNLEVTRVYRKLDKYYSTAPESAKKGAEYELYLRVKKEVETKYKEASEALENINILYTNYHFADSVVKATLKKDTYTAKDLKKIRKKSEVVTASVNFINNWAKKGVDFEEIKAYKEYLEDEALYRYNVDFDPRGIVGDNWETNANPYYGNNDVAGPDPSHGTAVAGNIAAVRNNGIGPDGVTCNVKLMIIRVVPDGDERDKDVANAIIYAVNNGAKVINMSFGKPYSPQKHFVDSALRIAATKDVLLIHAAGNEADNNDEIVNYPYNRDENGKAIDPNWLTVGASSQNAGATLPATFSNYGQTTVDLFAPGVDLYSLAPGNQYTTVSGTSMACPVTTGVAAIIRAFYPELTAGEVKEILMASVTKYDGIVNIPGEARSKQQTPFSALSVSGGVVNAYKALQLAEEKVKSKK